MQTLQLGCVYEFRKGFNTSGFCVLQFSWVHTRMSEVNLYKLFSFRIYLTSPTKAINKSKEILKNTACTRNSNLYLTQESKLKINQLPKTRKQQFIYKIFIFERLGQEHK